MAAIAAGSRNSSCNLSSFPRCQTQRQYLVTKAGTQAQGSQEPVSSKWIVPSYLFCISIKLLLPGVVTVLLVEVFLHSFSYLPYQVNLHSSHNLSRGTSTKLQSDREYRHPLSGFNYGTQRSCVLQHIQV